MYRDDFRAAQRDYYWTLPRIAAGLIVGGIVLGTATFGLNLLSQPARIVSKTFDADNVLLNYEKFHDVNANYLARLAQVKQFKGLLAAETDAQERQRLRIDMTAQQASCRDLARKYNADAEKLNKGLFRSRDLPETLLAGACE